MHGPGDIIQHRIASATIVEAGGLTAPQAAEIFNRLNVVESAANATNPSPRAPNTWISTRTHGLGGDFEDATLDINRVLWTPIFLESALTTTQMAVYVTTAASGGAIELGIYSRGGALLGTFGTVSTNTVGLKIAQRTAFTIPAGASWCALRTNGVSGMGIQMYDPVAPMLYDSNLSAVGAWGMPRPEASLPASWTWEFGQTLIPNIFVKVP